MRVFKKIAIAAAVVAAMLQIGLVNGFGQLPNCPVRPAPGSIVQNPFSLKSQNGVLTVDLALRNAVDDLGFMHYCYDYPANDGTGKFSEAPTLRLNPGDTLVLNLADRTTPNPGSEEKAMAEMGPMQGDMDNASGDCQGGPIISTTTNLHFHGMNVPPVCHQDDVISTLLQTGDPPFQYKIQIPANEPPGLYWYHPHAHGQTTTQVDGGASGALIVEGIEKVHPELVGLKERVLILRQMFINQNSWVPGPFDYTINFQTVLPDVFPLPLIAMEPGKKEFWRFLNAGTQSFVRIQVKYSGIVQPLELISLDGVPLTSPRQAASIIVPPAGRAEFVVTGPPPGTLGQFVTSGVYTGKVGNANPASFIANIITNASPAVPNQVIASPAPAPASAVPQRFAGLENATPTAQRKLYFSELVVTPKLIDYFITVEGQRPKLFSANQPPSIVTHVGAVEDWTVENRAEEIHAFHIHQIHFLLMAIDGKPVAHPELLDTVDVDPWSGHGPFPSVTLRMDFRDPEIAGTFVYHCHILDHEDAGMMAKILVKPAGGNNQAVSSASAKPAVLAKSSLHHSGR